MENKLPVVYVARELRGYKNFSSGIRELAYFVSQAYLTQETIEYNVDGTTDKQFKVIFNTKNCKNVDRGLYVEYEPKTTYHIFYNYNDCKKYVEREIRRGNKYDAIIMDPPSYGRGPNGEVWKLEQQLSELLTDVGKLISDDPIFFFLNSYTGGLSPTILNYMVKSCIAPKNIGTVFTEEIGIKVTKRDVVLPCGNTTIWMK